MYMKHIFSFVTVLLLSTCALLLVWVFGRDMTTPSDVVSVPTTTPSVVVSNFEECARVVGVVMESYPRQCRYREQTFVEEVGGVVEKMDIIQLTTPQPNEVISTPLVVRGQARGNWFFEGSFPVTLTNWDGLIIAEGVAQAQVDPSDTSGQGWMTTEFVPFSVTLTFEYPTVYDRGSLILKKENPSGLPENDDALEIPVKFSSTSTVEVMY